MEPALRTDRQQVAVNAHVRIISLLSKAKPQQSNILRKESHAVCSLKADPHLMILPADKGCATVILDCCEYDKKLQTILDDPQTYKKIDKDPGPCTLGQMTYEHDASVPQ